MWRVVIEYCKLAGIFHGKDPARRAYERIGDTAVTKACEPLDRYFIDLWKEYPDWKGESRELQDAWVELGRSTGTAY
jgi:hypothetical protein